MRTWIGGAAVLAAVGGVYFLTAGGEDKSHCGPCLAGTCPAVAPASVLPPDDVVTVVDVARAPDDCASPRPLPWVAFDGPAVSPVGFDQPAPDRIPAADDSPF